MGILITKRKQMRKLFIRTLALALCLTLSLVGSKFIHKSI